MSEDTPSIISDGGGEGSGRGWAGGGLVWRRKATLFWRSRTCALFQIAKPRIVIVFANEKHALVGNPKTHSVLANHTHTWHYFGKPNDASYYRTAGVHTNFLEAFPLFGEVCSSCKSPL